jgi:hypothetical protein
METGYLKGTVTKDQLMQFYTNNAVAGGIGAAVLLDAFATGGQASRFIFGATIAGSFYDNPSSHPEVNAQRDQTLKDNVAWSVMSIGVGFGAGKMLSAETEAIGFNSTTASEPETVGFSTNNIKADRQRAVYQAWKQERNMVKNTGRGTVDWTESQQNELITTGKVKGYEGHHINSVKGHPEMAGNPNNIKFVTPQENLDLHGGNFQNPTTGPLIERESDFKPSK